MLGGTGSAGDGGWPEITAACLVCRSRAPSPPRLSLGVFALTGSLLPGQSCPGTHSWYIFLVGPERPRVGILNFMPMGNAVGIFQCLLLGLVEVEAEVVVVSPPSVTSPTAAWIQKIRPRIGLLLSRLTDRKFTPVLFSLLGLIAPWGMGMKGEKG